MSDAKKWFIAVEDPVGGQSREQKVGPLSEHELAGMVQAGKVNASTMAWNPDLPEWAPLEKTGFLARVSEILSAPVPTPVAVVAPQFTSEPSYAPATSPTTTVKYGGFWIRWLACIIDNILLSCLLMAVITVVGMVLRMQGMPLDQLMSVLQITNILVSLISSFLYFAIIQTAMQGSPGKKVCGLILTSENGERMTMGQGIVRYLMLIVASIPFGIGVIALAWNPKKQGWHDRVANTIVTYKAIS